MTSALRLSACVACSCLSTFFSASAQKPALDTAVLYHWPHVENGFLSSDGRYGGYTIREEPAGRKTLVVKDIQSSRQYRWINAGKALFSRDNRQLIVQQADTLQLQPLTGGPPTQLAPAGPFKLFAQAREEYLSFLLKDQTQRLVLRSLQTGRQDTILQVEDWLPSPDGHHLLLEKAGSNKTHRVSWLQWPSGAEQLLWEDDANAGNWIVDPAGTQLAFTVEEKNGNKQIWFYRQGDAKAKKIADDNTPGIEDGMIIARLDGFSRDHSRLMLRLKEKPRPRADPDLVSVDIWSYQDAKLQSQQLFEAAQVSSKTYLATLSLRDGAAILQAQHSSETLTTPQKWNATYLVVDSMQGHITENYWSSAAQFHYTVVEMTTGKRSPIHQYVDAVSPSEKFLILKDQVSGDLSSYELSSGQLRPLTRLLAVAPLSEKPDRPNAIDMRRLFLLGWLPDDQAVLVADWHDIWELDPLGRRAPINLTGHYGTHHQLVFGPAIDFPDRIITGDSLLLTAFDNATKDNGFFKVALHKEQQPLLLSMAPCLWYAPYQYLFPGSPAPVKAPGAEVYLVQRQTAEESPNYYTTTDFRTFTPLSTVYPEQGYRWMKTRLVNFQRDDSTTAQGVLFLPQDADSTTRYPFLLHYYENKSNEFHQYLPPEGPNGELNIAWFVSHGYGVFTPDIHFTIGRTGESVLSTVNGAVRMLKALPQVDTDRLALQGHSYGGWSTLYLLTHTRGFAAALASSGACDLVGEYGDLWTGGESKSSFMEKDQGRMGLPPWEDPGRYIRNSPLFAAEKASTPVLMVSNKNDHSVSFSQGVEMFTALRRLGKPAWMLQYDKGGHGLYGRERIDYLLRSTQFFDHYLKGMPAPRWMTQGIPAMQKGLSLGFQLDIQHPEPLPGLLRK